MSHEVTNYEPLYSDANECSELFYSNQLKKPHFLLFSLWQIGLKTSGSCYRFLLFTSFSITSTTFVSNTPPFFPPPHLTYFSSSRISLPVLFLFFLLLLLLSQLCYTAHCVNCGLKSSLLKAWWGLLKPMVQNCRVRRGGGVGRESSFSPC